MQAVSDAADPDDPAQVGLHPGQLGDTDITGKKSGDYKGQSASVLYEGFCDLPSPPPGRSLTSGQPARYIEAGFQEVEGVSRPPLPATPSRNCDASCAGSQHRTAQ